MRQAARITLFVQDNDGTLETVPDLEVLHALMQQTPLVNRNPDGSRTFVFDLPDPSSVLTRVRRTAAPDPNRLRAHIAAMGSEARALGLPLTAALADSAEIVAETELGSVAPPRIRS